MAIYISTQVYTHVLVSMRSGTSVNTTQILEYVTSKCNLLFLLCPLVYYLIYDMMLRSKRDQFNYTISYSQQELLCCTINSNHFTK